MTRERLDEWAADFEAFHARFAPFFGRREPREALRRYLRGLLEPLPRKNCWQLAEALGDPNPQALQRLLYQVAWDADAVQKELRRFILETFGDPEGIGVVDESAFVKKGAHSVGVKRQWCGTLGKTENCQVGVFLAYVSPRGYAFLDRRLYLPEEWAGDAARRAVAQVPKEVRFYTKGELAQAMLEAAWEQGVPMRWVTGDEVYGDAPYLRARIAAQGMFYVLAVAKTTPAAVHPGRESNDRYDTDRSRAAPGRAAEAQAARTVGAVVATWPAAHWERLTIAAGEKGPRTYDWAAARIRSGAEAEATEELWLLARRSVEQPEEIAYYLSNAPAATPLLTLAQVAGSRWRIEQALEEAKGEAGLDEYEVRYWHSWRRHITLSLMAHSWLTAIRQQEHRREAGKKAGPTGGHRPEAGGRIGRVDGGGSPAPAGDRLAAAGAPRGVPLGLVRLAAVTARAGAREPLPAVRGCVSATN